MNGLMDYWIVELPAGESPQLQKPIHPEIRFLSGFNSG
jgi:hypothetical protein